MITITRVKGSNPGQDAVYTLDGVIVASSYQRHASGLIQFWNTREQRTIRINESDFNRRYTTRRLT